MALRKELEPNIETAQKLYPAVFELISSYDHACDLGKPEQAASAVQQIARLTSKDVKQEDIAEYWGWISKEDLAFQLALPQAGRVEHFNKVELVSILESPKLLEDKFSIFYQELLEKNFPHPTPYTVVFGTDESADMIAEVIMNYQVIQP